MCVNDLPDLNNSGHTLKMLPLQYMTSQHYSCATEIMISPSCIGYQTKVISPEIDTTYMPSISYQIQVPLWENLPSLPRDIISDTAISHSHMISYPQWLLSNTIPPGPCLYPSFISQLFQRLLQGHYSVGGWCEAKLTGPLQTVILVQQIEAQAPCITFQGQRG